MIPGNRRDQECSKKSWSNYYAQTHTTLTQCSTCLVRSFMKAEDYRGSISTIRMSTMLSVCHAAICMK